MSNVTLLVAALAGPTVSGAPSGATMQAGPYVPAAVGGPLGLLIPAGTFLLFPFVIALAVRLVRRRPPAALPPQWNEVPDRLERLEQAVGAIAIEVERVSEGQRFLTKVLTDGGAAASASRGALAPGSTPGQAHPQGDDPR